MVSPQNEMNIIDVPNVSKENATHKPRWRGGEGRTHRSEESRRWRIRQSRRMPGDRHRGTRWCARDREMLSRIRTIVKSHKDKAFRNCNFQNEEYWHKWRYKSMIEKSWMEGNHLLITNQLSRQQSGWRGHFRGKKEPYLMIVNKYKNEHKKQSMRDFLMQYTLISKNTGGVDTSRWTLTGGAWCAVILLPV